MTRLLAQFRRKLADGFVLGPFCKTTDPAFVEIMGHCGFDFVILDLEHGPVSVQNLQNLIRAAELAGIVPIVRVKEDRLSSIGESLDTGAAGIQAPQVTTAEDAARIVQHAKFAPEGMRGVCRFVRAAHYSSQDRFEYFADANRNLVVVQLEGAEALHNVEEILDVQGIDIVFIGPYDLSQSLGVPGKTADPVVTEKMQEIVTACKHKKRAVGTFVDTPEDAARWIDAGVSYVSYSVDVGLFTDACKRVVSTISGAGTTDT